MKLNELKKAKLNELDLSSFFGDYGSAATRTGIGSLGGKNVLSTTDQMAKDDFIKKFNSRALSGLESAINGGLVDPNAVGQGAQTTGQTTSQITQTTQQGKLPSAADAIAQKRIDAQKLAQQRADAEGMPSNKLPNQAAPNPAQTRKEKLAAATQAAQGQMTPKTPAVAANTPETPEQIRRAKQLAATQAAQGQMNPASKLPADQFNKSADNVRQQQQTTATQVAQQQMSASKQADPRYPNGKYDGVTGKPTPEYQKELDKSAAAQAEKDKAAAIASQAQAKSNDDMAANMNNIATQRNIPNAPQATIPNVSTGADTEQAALDKMKQKNPKLAGMMAQAGLDDNLDDIKPDNTIKMPKRNVKPRNAGKNAFGQMAQNLGGRVAEGSRFDKLNYIFESILAEQDSEQGGTKQTISQYITNFFKQFMKGVNISDPSVTTQVASLAKELEQNYAKDKGKSAIPKLADLGWSVSHAQAEENPQQSTTPGKTGASQSPASAPETTNTTPQAAQASTQQAKITATQITKLMQGLSTRQKQSVLKSLQTQLSKTPQVASSKNNTGTVQKIKGAKAGLPTADEEAKFQQRIQQASGK